VAGEALFIGDRDGKLYARSLSSGAEIWTQQEVPGKGQLLASPLVIPEQGLVLVAPYQGSNWLVAYSTAGALKWAFAPSQ
jgi:outer membrane protein assembly factor BamB